MSTELRNVNRAYDLATQEDQIRSILRGSAKEEQETIDLVTEFLTDHPDCTSSLSWASNDSEHNSDELVGKLVGELASIATNKPSNSQIDYLIFYESDLFKSLKISSLRQIKIESEKLISPENPNSTERMNTIIDYLRGNK